MTIHSSMPAWIIPWTVGPGGLQSMGLLRVRHDSTHTCMRMPTILKPFSVFATPSRLKAGLTGT